MNKAKHEAQPVPESVLSMRPTGSASTEGDAQSAGKGVLRAPREHSPRQWSIFTEGKKWGWTKRTRLVISNRYKKLKSLWAVEMVGQISVDPEISSTVIE